MATAKGGKVVQRQTLTKLLLQHAGAGHHPHSPTPTQTATSPPHFITLSKHIYYVAR